MYNGDRSSLEGSPNNLAQSGLWPQRGLSDVETNEIENVEKKPIKPHPQNDVTQVPKLQSTGNQAIK
jgi:hypothetical protein